VQLEALDQKIGELRAALQSADREEISKLLHAGKVGREKIPGKHGAKNRNYTMLPVVIEDKPGQLARLFEECSQANVNVEDLTIEHSPAQETGLITLALSSSDAQILEAHLLNAGWRVHSPLK
jgi:prephenate dehydrogenase